jgi:hypothetical protein
MSRFDTWLATGTGSWMSYGPVWKSSLAGYKAILNRMDNGPG